jgi:hypothetical protein
VNTGRELRGNLGTKWQQSLPKPTSVKPLIVPLQAKFSDVASRDEDEIGGRESEAYWLPD